MTPILNHYFARINWLGAAAANIDTLRALHLKHNCTIPFENLDVLLPKYSLMINRWKINW